MAITNPNLEDGFDLNGSNLLALTTALKDDGFSQNEIPKSGHINTVFKELYRYVQFLKETGISQWDNATSYKSGARIMRDEVLYKSLSDANQGNDPLSAPSFWSIEDRDIPGTMIEYGGSTPPAGYLIYDASELSKTIYAALFAVIGTNFNTTAGALEPAIGNFRLPPSEIGGFGLYNRGVGAANGGVGTYQEDVFKSHTHSYVRRSDTASDGGNIYAGVHFRSYTANVASTGDAEETRPRTLTVLRCIKY